MSSSSEPAAPATPASSRPANPAGRASLIAAAVLVLLASIQQVVSVFIPSIASSLELDFTAIGIYYSIAAVIQGLLALVPLILGIIGLTRPGLPKGAAGAGTAIGATTILGVLVSLVAAPIASLLG